MPKKSYASLPDKDGYVREWCQFNSISSPRLWGHMHLKANDHLNIAGRTIVLKYPPALVNFGWKRPLSGRDIPVELLRSLNIRSLEERCYTKLRSKLYYGSASLGVSIASYKESREMVVARFKTLTTEVDELAASILLGRTTKKRFRRKLSNAEKRRRSRRNTGSRRNSARRKRYVNRNRQLENLAGLHLETIFGWMPLVQDIQKACQTVIQQADASRFISVSASSQAIRTASIDTIYASARVSYAAKVTLTNQNAWLAERAGLLNPVAVAWDLVPWSFVVNMFVNTASIVNQITDFTGLSFSDASLTTTVKNRAQRRAETPYGVFYQSTTGFDKRRRTDLVLPPRPGLSFRLPDANWSTAAMAASLFIQRFSRLSSLVAPLWEGATRASKRR